jgi:thiamine biosynthesis protein ThiI
MKAVMVRYGELFLKSEPVKRYFINVLVKNMRQALDAAGHSYRFETPRGRLLVYGDNPEAMASIISRVFGVVDVSVCTQTSGQIDEIAAAAVELADSRLKPGMSFAVRPRRQGVTGFTSQELGAVIGDAICRKHPETRVDLGCPDYEVFVEARDFGGLVCDVRKKAPGGLPWGTQGRVISLLSAGIDSPVASWLAMRRGCEVIHLHIDSGSWAGSNVFESAVENHRRLSLWCQGYPLTMLVLNNEALHEAMHARVQARYVCVLCKRFMMKAASRLMEEHQALGLVTGENLGQVASQTLSNLAVIARAAPPLVIRPLVTYDKNETVTLAREIGTFNPIPGDLSCRAVPSLPATEANLQAVIRCEEEIEMESLLEESMSTLRTITAMNGEIRTVDL